MYKKLLKRYARYRYVKAMMEAIKLAQATTFGVGKLSSKTDGLRAIRRFEKINKVKFDPFSTVHTRFVTGCGIHEEFFRSASRIFISS